MVHEVHDISATADIIYEKRGSSREHQRYLHAISLEIVVAFNLLKYLILLSSHVLFPLVLIKSVPRAHDRQGSTQLLLSQFT